MRVVQFITLIVVGLLGVVSLLNANIQEPPVAMQKLKYVEPIPESSKEIYFNETSKIWVNGKLVPDVTHVPGGSEITEMHLRETKKGKLIEEIRFKAPR